MMNKVEVILECSTLTRIKFERIRDDNDEYHNYIYTLLRDGVVELDRESFHKLIQYLEIIGKEHERVFVIESTYGTESQRNIIDKDYGYIRGYIM